MKLSLLFASLFLSLTSQAAMNINGAGSTFAEPLYTKWMSEFQKVDSTTQFNYQGVGSGAGIKQMLAGTVDFAGTDDPMNSQDAAKAKSAVLHVPIAMGAVVVTYHLSEVTKPLKLTGEVVAKIFNGLINKWNDPQISQLNPGVKLPDLAIAVATRSDGSGTTAVFTDYLAKVSPEWVGKNGKTVNWFKGSIGAKGNAGVTGLVRQTPGAIGYVELVYALENKLPTALIQNKSGQYIEASAKTVSNAAIGIKKEALAKDFKVSLTNSNAKEAYPISSFTWMLVYEKLAKEKKAIADFAKWTLSDSAQGIAAAINYAPVPKELRAEVLAKIAKIKIE